MAASTADIGLNSKMQIEDPANPGVFLDMGELYAIQPPTREREFVDVTNFESPGGARERIPALINIGRATYNISMKPASTNYGKLVTAFDGGNKLKFRINPPDTITTKVFEWTGYVASIKDNVMLDDKNTTEIEIEATGPATGWIVPS
ncbi:MAG: hypothetical protein IT435_05625 [Phycisphaerales bacterium]|nr:hypothetical protein [Phycisphaerales bacterium]